MPAEPYMRHIGVLKVKRAIDAVSAFPAVFKLWRMRRRAFPLQLPFYPQHVHGVGQRRDEHELTENEEGRAVRDKLDLETLKNGAYLQSMHGWGKRYAARSCQARLGGDEGPWK